MYLPDFWMLGTKTLPVEAKLTLACAKVARSQFLPAEELQPCSSDDYRSCSYLCGISSRLQSIGTSLEPSWVCACSLPELKSKAPAVVCYASSGSHSNVLVLFARAPVPCPPWPVCLNAPQVRKAKAILPNLGHSHSADHFPMCALLIDFFPFVSQMMSLLDALASSCFHVCAFLGRMIFPFDLTSFFWMSLTCFRC